MTEPTPAFKIGVWIENGNPWVYKGNPVLIHFDKPNIKDGLYYAISRCSSCERHRLNTVHQYAKVKRWMILPP